MADMNQVLSRLAVRSVQDSVPWRNSELSGTFQASLGNLTVFIAGSRNRATRFVHLSVQDGRGVTIGSLSYNSTYHDENPELASLYEDAKRIASEDSRLDELIDVLDAAPPVP